MISLVSKLYFLSLKRKCKANNSKMRGRKNILDIPAEVLFIIKISSLIFVIIPPIFPVKSLHKFYFRYLNYGFIKVWFAGG